MKAWRANYPHVGRMAVIALMLLLTSGALADKKYLIVSAPDYVGSAPLTQFINHRTARGFDVSVYSVPVGTSRDNIKAHIQGLWGTEDAPEYLLIVGDTSGSSSTSTTIPHWVGQGSRQATTDLPYACMDGASDWYPDMYLGRFSVTSVSMLQQVVDKTICVESGGFSDPNYVRRAAMLATDDPTASAASLHNSIISTYLEPAGFTATRVYAAEGGGSSQISAAVNAGVLFTVYFGHSGSSGWSSPGFNQSNVNALTNQGLYGLTMGWSCNTAHFDYDECFGETWLRAANKAAAAYLSASSYVWWGSADAWESSRRMERYFFQSFFDENIWEVGPAWQAALWKILADPDFGPTHDHTRNIFEEMVLLGDPALRLPFRALDMSLPEGCPEFIPPGVPTSIVVRIESAAEMYVPGSGVLNYRYDGGDYQTVALVPLDGPLYQANLPAPDCGAVPEYYFSAEGDQGGIVSFPERAPEDVLSATVATVTPRLDDDFEAAQGWTVVNDPSVVTGAWERAVPAGTSQTGAPVADYDGSGTCFVTDNGTGNHDVDLGPTMLISPAIDVSGMSEVHVCYARWIYSDDTFGPDQDFLDVEFSSDDGATWVPVEHVSALGNWVKVNIVANDYVPLTAHFRMRFSVNDTPNNSITEAAVDDVRVYDQACRPAAVLGDLNCDGAVNAFDIDPFVLALTAPGVWEEMFAGPDCEIMRADINQDGQINAFDIDPFVLLLTGS
jgi:hypothetical protein